MKKLLTLLVTAGTIILVTGCATGAIKEVRTEVWVPPSYLTEPIVSEEPPVLNEYLQLSYVDKEQVWTSKFRQQTLAIDVCNVRFRNIRELGAKQKQHFENQSTK